MKIITEGCESISKEVEICIGINRYILNENNDALRIRKRPDGDSENIAIYPICDNVIEIN